MKIAAIVALLLIASPVWAQTTRASTESIPGTVVKFDMIRLPGDEKIKPFWIGKCEVTWDEYDIFAYSLDMTEKQRASGEDAESRPSKPYAAPDRGYGHSGWPAGSVTGGAGDMYCKWLSEKTKKSYRLPTEKEWEYACAAGKGMKLLDVAWVKENSEKKTHKVGTKLPNAFGLYDMIGNVGEWCIGKDEKGEEKGVLRGGSFKTKTADISCATSETQNEDWNASDPQIPKSIWWLADGPFAGFRIVRDDEEGEHK